MGRRHGAWVRYQDPVSPDQVEFAIEHYRAAILQPWETEVATRLKQGRPDMTVLAYQCLSSTRDYELGPIYSSGVCFEEAEESGEHWFAHRLDGSRIQWATYRGHWQMATWEEEYRQRWCDNVADLLEASPFDGVMADNDVFDDYYGIAPPIEGGRTMADLRGALDRLVQQAGQRLNDMGKVLVPNIAESRREAGRWARHAAYGGGFEEVWLAWGPDDFLDPQTALLQMDQLNGPGITIVRVATDGADDHPNVRYGLAAYWVFGGGSGNAAYTATSHDGYSGTPFVTELGWDLGDALGEVHRRGNGYSRLFADGFAAVNLNEGRRRKVRFDVPQHMLRADGSPATGSIVLMPHEGVVLRRG